MEKWFDVDHIADCLHREEAIKEAIYQIKGDHVNHDNLMGLAGDDSLIMMLAPSFKGTDTEGKAFKARYWIEGQPSACAFLHMKRNRENDFFVGTVQSFSNNYTGSVEAVFEKYVLQRIEEMNATPGEIISNDDIGCAEDHDILMSNCYKYAEESAIRLLGEYGLMRIISESRFNPEVDRPWYSPRPTESPKLTAANEDNPIPLTGDDVVKLYEEGLKKAIQNLERLRKGDFDKDKKHIGLFLIDKDHFPATGLMTKIAADEIRLV